MDRRERESIVVTSKILKKFLCLKHVFTDKVIKREKKGIKKSVCHAPPPPWKFFFYTPGA
jgi:hypothetical protein